MPKLISKNVESAVKTLSEEKNSYKTTKEKLKEKGTEISLGTITNIINDIGIGRQAATRGEKKPKFRRPPVKRTQGAIQKVQGYVNKKNPETYRYNSFCEKVTPYVYMTVYTNETTSLDFNNFFLKMNFKNVKTQIQ